MNKLKIATFIFIFLSGIYVYGYFVCNEPEIIFDQEPIENGGENTQYTSLNRLVIDGAGYFLQSNSDYQLFLKKIELSAISRVSNREILVPLDNAIKSMELAKSSYYQIIQLANNLEYNLITQEKFRYFDYSGYQKDNNLNPVVFQQLEELLKTGDVRGCYQKFFTQIIEILERLGAIKTDVEAGNLPGIPECWRLNQMYLETELFGQYASEVFMNL